MNNWYVGKVYSGDKFLGFVCGTNSKELKRKASKMCSGYYNTHDSMKVRVYKGEEIIGGLSFSRFNKKFPNNEIKRGVWT